MGNDDRWRGTLIPAAGLLGAGGIIVLATASGDDATLIRNVYATRLACESDYSPTQCTTGQPPDNPAWALGPKYRVIKGIPTPCGASDAHAGRAQSVVPRPDGDLIETRVVQRGGFGSRCSSRSSGGGGSSSGHWWGGRSRGWFGG